MALAADHDMIMQGDAQLARSLRKFRNLLVTTSTSMRPRSR